MMSPAAADPRRDEIHPPPGSAAAAALGCLCPVLVNGPSAASDNPLIAPDCAVHSPPET